MWITCIIAMDPERAQVEPKSMKKNGKGRVSISHIDVLWCITFWIRVCHIISSVAVILIKNCVDNLLSGKHVVHRPISTTLYQIPDGEDFLEASSYFDTDFHNLAFRCEHEPSNTSVRYTWFVLSMGVGLDCARHTMTWLTSSWGVSPF